MGRRRKSILKFRQNPDLVCPKIEGTLDKTLPCWKCPKHEDCLQQFNMTFLFFGGTEND